MTGLRYDRPADFDRYWSDVREDLAQTPAHPEVEAIPIRATDFATLYGVRLTSIGPYRIYGYLSVPAGDGPFPAIYWPPKYGSVLEIIPQGTANEIRSRFVTFSCAGRGQRNADQPFAAMFPGLLTVGIDSGDDYVFRGIVADGIRGLEFLRSRDEVDLDRVAVIGNDVAMQVVSLAGSASHLVCTPALFFDPLGRAAETDSYPLEEYNDYLRHHPSDRAGVEATLGRFDLRGFAPGVRSHTLLMAGPEGSVLGPETLSALADSIAGEVSMYASRRSSYLDGVHMEFWIADRLGFDAPILPEHWR